MTERPQDPARRDPGDRRRLLWPALAAGAVLLAVGAGVIAAMLTGTGEPTASGSRPSPTSGSSASPTPGESATPEPGATETPAPTPTIDPVFGEPVADTTDPGGTADFGDDITARLISSTRFNATASQPGEISGPAIRVELEIQNDTGGAISLDAATVNAYYGSDKSPASPVDSDASSDPFSGSVGSGDAARGIYVFSVPDGQDDIVITLSKSPGSALVVFE